MDLANCELERRLIRARRGEAFRRATAVAAVQVGFGKLRGSCEEFLEDRRIRRMGDLPLRH